MKTPIHTLLIQDGKLFVSGQKEPNEKDFSGDQWKENQANEAYRKSFIEVSDKYTVILLIGKSVDLYSKTSNLVLDISDKNLVYGVTDKQFGFEWKKVAIVSRAEGEKGCTCHGCGKTYHFDIIVPDDMWAKISPKPVEGFKGGGLLCPACIILRVYNEQLWSAAFLTNVKNNRTCVSCDQEKEVHEMCLQCAIKFGIENAGQKLYTESEVREAIKKSLEKAAENVKLLGHDYADGSEGFKFYPHSIPTPFIIDDGNYIEVDKSSITSEENIVL